LLYDLIRIQFNNAVFGKLRDRVDMFCGYSGGGPKKRNFTYEGRFLDC